MQLCKIMYYSLAALHVSSDIFAHHQEHQDCITVSGITHVCRCWLVGVSSNTPMIPASSDILVCYQKRTPPTAHSNRFQLFHDSGR
jgi:hypothetical protein